MKKIFLALMLMAATAAHAEVKPCVVGGCSKQLCVEDGEHAISNCIWTERYRCYQTVGKCERQQDGKCGWTQTDELQDCFKKTDSVHPLVPAPTQ